MSLPFDFWYNPLTFGTNATFDTKLAKPVKPYLVRQRRELRFINRAAQIFLVLFVPLVAAAFIFKLLRRQNGRARAGPQLLFFNRYLVNFFRHFVSISFNKPLRPQRHSSKDEVGCRQAVVCDDRRLTTDIDSGMLQIRLCDGRVPLSFNNRE
jgi:hypothetical protein